MWVPRVAAASRPNLLQSSAEDAESTFEQLEDEFEREVFSTKLVFGSDITELYPSAQVSKVAKETPAAAFDSNQSVPGL